MSVEEARKEVYEMAIADDAHWEPRQREANGLIDRLILEVQAEMPCCYQDRPLSCLEEQKRSTVHLCPSCTARMKLKEIADAR